MRGDRRPPLQADPAAVTDPLTRLSPTLLAGHLACAHLTQLERKRHAGELVVEFNADPRLEAMRVRGQQHEARYVEGLRAEGRDVCDLTGTKDPAATLAAMRRGCDVIVQAPLANGSFFGYADVLLRVPAPSTLGDYSYEPVDTKLALETKAGTILQLCNVS
jgi:predicted RecB family nuclease